MCASVVPSIVTDNERFSFLEGAVSDATHISPRYAISSTLLKIGGSPTGVTHALAPSNSAFWSIEPPDRHRYQWSIRRNQR